MYINFNVVKFMGYSPSDVFNLQIIFQNRTESLEELISDSISNDILMSYSNKGLVTFIKEKNKKDTLANRVRIAPNGSELLSTFQIPEVNEDDLKLYAWLESVYKSENKEIGNRKKTKVFIALFRVNSGIDRNKLAYLCKVFMNDTSQFEWSRVLEYLFFKPANMYSTKFDLEESKLYKYYLRYQDMFDNKFKKLE